MNTPLECARIRLENARAELAYAQEAVESWEKRIEELTPPLVVGDRVRHITTPRGPAMRVLAIDTSFGEWVAKVHWPYSERPTYYAASELEKVEN